MKQLFILVMMILVSISSFAQRNAHVYAQPVSSVQDGTFIFPGLSTYSRTTAVGDTFKLSNIAVADTPYVVYSVGADSGYITGTDYWDDSAFAERYDFNGEDSSVNVIGVFAQFAGKVNPTSAKSISLNVWNVGAPQYIASNTLYSGFPNALLATDTIPFTQLGIGTTKDTLKPFMFSSPTGHLVGSFFVGYSMSYNFITLAGDTIGLASSHNGDRTSPVKQLQVVITDIDTVVDTLINVQNATLYTDGNWHDNYTNNDSLYNDLAIFPIVIIGNSATGVKGVTKNNFTLFGNYPNPAVNTTNIKYSLANKQDVTIQVMDMNGRVLNTITQPGQVAGEHIVPVNTSAMAAGNYLYLIHTSGGAGMASEMTVVR